MSKERTGRDRQARTLVVGAGSLGLLVATTLASRGYRTTLFGRDPVQLDQINARGAQVVGDLPVDLTPLEATERLAEPTEPFELVIVATGPKHAVAATRAATSWLRPDGVLLCLGGELQDALIAGIVGPSRYLGAVATFAASSVEPGVVERCGEGGLVVGGVHVPGALGWAEEVGERAARSNDGGTDDAEADDAEADDAEANGAEADDAEAANSESLGSPGPTADARALRETGGHPHAWVLRALEALAPVSVTEHLLGARWAELALRCGFEPLTAVTGLRIGELANHGAARSLFLEIVGEVALLASELDVTLERLPSLPALLELIAGDGAMTATTSDAQVHARHERVHNLAGRYAHARGALGERARHGRALPTTSLRALTVERATQLGVATPTLRASLDLVDRVSRRTLPVSIGNLRLLQQLRAHAKT